MPRIAVVTSYFPIREAPQRGHSAYQKLRILQRWADLTVFCPIASYPHYPRLWPRTYTYIDADLSYSPPDVRACLFRYPVFPILTRPVNGWMCDRYLKPHLDRFQPDLILSYWLYPDGYAAVRAGRRLGVPVIVAALGSDLRLATDPITKRLVRRTLLSATRVLTVSEELRQRAIRLGVPPDHAQTVLNGCDPEIFHLSDRGAARRELNLDPEARIILYVGALIALKGLRELLEAFRELHRNRQRLELIFVGEGPLRQELQQRAAATGLAGSVRLTGRSVSGQVARWMAASDVFCLPSHSEGCPNVVIEAVACGRPVVATRVGGIPELVDNNSGILVPPGDVRQLTAALGQALDRRWEEAALSRRHRRTWEQAARETYETCLEVLAAHGNVPTQA